MNLSNVDQRRFPRATRYLRSSLPTVINIPIIRRAMNTHGQLNRAQFRTALSWGTNPRILIVAGLGACGTFTPVAGNHTIRIRESLFTNFEAGNGQGVARAGNAPLLGVTILHEMCHWGDMLDGVNTPGVEDGDAFEQMVYGGRVGGVC